jgi:DNA-directed RNA polymerase subunit beta
MNALNNGNSRINFSASKIQLEYPDFLEIQLKSFSDFFQMGTSPEDRKNEGLYKVFNENFPISDTRNNFVLEFIDYFIDPPGIRSKNALKGDCHTAFPLRQSSSFTAQIPNTRILIP